MIWPTLRSINSRQSAMYCNALQCIASEVKALPPVEKSSSRDPDKRPPHGGRAARSSIKWHRVSAKNQLGFETKGHSSPPRHFLTLEPAKINPGVETRIRKILFKQLAAHFSRQSLRKTCGHASLNKAGRKFCPNVFLMVGFLWPGFSLHRLWVSP